MTSEQIWIAFGLTGQILFTARFVVQWLSSEREKRSVIPPMFWYFSIGSSSGFWWPMQFTDETWYSWQWPLWSSMRRNLQLIRNEKAQTAIDASEPKPDVNEAVAATAQQKAA